MKIVGRNILISIGVAFLLSQLQELLNSKYIIKFLDRNLLTLLIALLAINITSLGIILTKIRELIDKFNIKNNFAKTKNEMLFSIREQITLIFISVLLLTLNDSSWLSDYPKTILIAEILVIACFVYSMLILYDTAKSVFVIINFKRDD